MRLGTNKIIMDSHALQGRIWREIVSCVYKRSISITTRFCVIAFIMEGGGLEAGYVFPDSEAILAPMVITKNVVIPNCSEKIHTLSTGKILKYPGIGHYGFRSESKDGRIHFAWGYQCFGVRGPESISFGNSIGIRSQTNARMDMQGGSSSGIFKQDHSAHLLFVSIDEIGNLKSIYPRPFVEFPACLQFADLDFSVPSLSTSVIWFSDRNENTRNAGKHWLKWVC